jgi:hypothetical protein
MVAVVQPDADDLVLANSMHMSGVARHASGVGKFATQSILRSKQFRPNRTSSIKDER